jgi:hypothetical protein
MTIASLKSEDEALYRDVMRLSESVAKHFDVESENQCTEVTHVGVEILKALGYDAKHISTHAETLAFKSDDDVDHDWIRVGDWNIDLTIRQYEDAFLLPYPFVTRKDNPLALDVYGKGSKNLRSPKYGILEGDPRWPSLKDLPTASPGDVMCDLDAFAAIVDEVLG